MSSSERFESHESILSVSWYGNETNSMDAVVICKICEDEKSFRVGWNLYQFTDHRYNHEGEEVEYNICHNCVSAIISKLSKVTEDS